MTSTAGLWLAVVLSGAYHGLNPGMGWPLAVSSALMEQRQSALWRALAALAGGHFLAMLGVLLPFAMMAVLIDYQREIRIGAALIVIAMGLYIAVTRNHPRFLSRVPRGRFKPDGGEATISGFCVEIDDKTGLATRAADLRLGGCLNPAEPLFWVSL